MLTGTHGYGSKLRSIAASTRPIARFCFSMFLICLRSADCLLDVLDHNAERREVLDPIDRDELTGDLVGQEVALLDVTASSGWTTSPP